MVAFEVMLSRMSQSSDPEIRGKGDYVRLSFVY